MLLILSKKSLQVSSHTRCTHSPWPSDDNFIRNRANTSEEDRAAPSRSSLLHGGQSICSLVTIWVRLTKKGDRALWFNRADLLSNSHEPTQPLWSSRRKWSLHVGNQAFNGSKSWAEPNSLGRKRSGLPVERDFSLLNVLFFSKKVPTFHRK
jgi:hypothetical protein